MVRFVTIRNKTPQGWAVKDKHTEELKFYPTRDRAKAARDIYNAVKRFRENIAGEGLPW